MGGVETKAMIYYLMYKDTPVLKYDSASVTPESTFMMPYITE